MDANQWPLGLDVVKQQVKASQHEQQVVERKARPRPQKEHALNCPRCNSTNTKFCYYNNYSLSQPRYFCKTCRRYWTEGGTTRNVPVGGGSRKNKRSSATASSTSSPSNSSSPSSLMKRKLPDPAATTMTFQNPRIRGAGGHLEDLNLLGYAGRNHHHHHHPENSTSCGLIPMFFGEGKSVGFDESPNNNLSSICHFVPAGNSSSIGFSLLGSTMQLTNNANNNVINADHPYFKLQSLDDHGHLNHHHIGYGNGRAVQEGAHFSHHPYHEEEEPSYNKPFTTSVQQAAHDHRYEVEQNKGQLGESSSGYWGGMLGGGGSW